MTPQVQLGEMDRMAEPAAEPMAEPRAEMPARRRELSDADRQGLAMAWMSIALGMFLLFGGLALWAAVALSAGFTGWIIGMAVMGVVVVAVLLTVTYAMIRPRR